MLALVLAAFPAVLSLGIGGLAVLAGNDISEAGRSYDDSSGYTYDYTTGSDSLTSFGDTTTDTGLWMVLLGGSALLFIVLAGTGSNLGRIITVVWLSGSVIWVLTRIDAMPDGSGGYILLFLIPPILAVVGFFSPSANTLYRTN